MQQQLFKFLKSMSENKYPFQLIYKEGMETIDVEVDAFTEKWVVSFSEQYGFEAEVFKKLEIDCEKNIHEVLAALCDRPKLAWVDAAKDLKIEFITPFKFTGNDGNFYEVTGLLPQFGGKNGTIISSRLDSYESSIQIDQLENFATSFLNPLYYDKYDRSIFIKALKDWGWNKTTPPPSWY